MENTMISVSPIQVLLALSFQIWIIVFPIIIIRKLNYLTELIRAQFETEGENPS